MSILVACKMHPSRVPETCVSSTIAGDALFTQATRRWGGPEGWLRVDPRGACWDDLVLDAISVGNHETLIACIEDLLQRGHGLSIWYASFHDDLPVTTAIQEFTQDLKRQLAEGIDEPSLRFEPGGP